MPDAIEVRKVPLHTVSDASELAKLIDDGVMEASRVIAVIGKTEGNGGVNDYTRIIADHAFRDVLRSKGVPGMGPPGLAWAGAAVCAAAVMLRALRQGFAARQVQAAVRAFDHGLGGGGRAHGGGRRAAGFVAPQAVGHGQHQQHEQVFHRFLPSTTSSTKREPT